MYKYRRRESSAFARKKELDNHRLATLIIRTDSGKKYQTPKYDEQLDVCLALAYFTTSYFLVKKEKKNNSSQDDGQRREMEHCFSGVAAENA